MLKKKFGTAPVFFTAISTILGAVMFLRFGFAVGNVGFIGTLGIIALGHIVTIATALSIAEIATNKKVEGGGEYFIISRSFGLKIGASIGIALFFSQAISVAFYIVAMMEAFNPIIDWMESLTGLYLLDKRFISIPVMALIAWIMLKYGAKMGLKALYIVVAILFLSIVLFFLGNTNYVEGFPISTIFEKMENGMDFFTVFAIIFPAFTGMTAGVGLSGDLKNPSKSLPIGTLAATITGMVIYVFIGLKLTYSASPGDLNADQLIMAKIALWGPIIPIGLAAATFSSALGSMMIAPRTLQAIAGDNIIPSKKINSFLSKSGADSGEPINATIVTTIFATFFLLIGDVNFVAKLISMFFMVTYGSLCLISFLEHFSSDPSYRPTFRSRWYFSFTGAVMCIWLMFSMNFLYAIAAIGVMVLLYMWIAKSNKEEKGLEAIFEGVIFQTSRKLQVFLQQKNNATKGKDIWRPSMISVSRNSFTKLDTLDFSRWIANKYGFCTYIHLIDGLLTKETNEQSKQDMQKLLALESNQKNNVYLDTIISPSYTSALIQAIQFPSISGKPNNVVLFDYNHSNEFSLNEVKENVGLPKSLGMDVCVLRTSSRGYGYRREINIWITADDFRNANLMILLGYIILGHKDWKRAQIKIYALLDVINMHENKAKLNKLITTGRIPISSNNIILVPNNDDKTLQERVNEKSADADLTFVGFNDVDINDNISLFDGYTNMGNMVFVSSINKKEIE